MAEFLELSLKSTGRHDVVLSNSLSRMMAPNQPVKIGWIRLS